MAKYVDYKWWYVRRDDNGYITEVAVRLFEGEYAEEENPDTKEKVRVYQRTNRINPEDASIKRLVSWTKETDPNGHPIIKFTNKDFGDIKSDEELMNFCKSQINKLKSKYTIIDS